MQDLALHSTSICTAMPNKQREINATHQWFTFSMITGLSSLSRRYCWKCTSKPKLNALFVVAQFVFVWRTASYTFVEDFHVLTWSSEVFARSNQTHCASPPSKTNVTTFHLIRGTVKIVSRDPFFHIFPTQCNNLSSIPSLPLIPSIPCLSGGDWDINPMILFFI